jgi:hypothetical protein
MSSTNSSGFALKRFKEFSQVILRQGITFLIYITAFGNLAITLDTHTYSDFLILYNYCILFCGILLLGYPTLLQHRFSLKSLRSWEIIRQLVILLSVSIMIAMIATFLLRIINPLNSYGAIISFMFLHTFFTQMLHISYGRGRVGAINLAEICGVSTFLLSTVVLNLTEIEQVFLILGLSFLVRNVILMIHFFSNATKVLTSTDQDKSTADISFWRISIISALNISLFRVLLPISEQHKITTGQLNLFLLAWPILERTLSLTSNCNAILYRLLAGTTPIILSITWILYTFFYNSNFEFDIQYVLILCFSFLWSLNSFQANLLVATRRLNILLILIVFKCIVYGALMILPALNIILGIECSIIIINISLFIFCLACMRAQN